MTQDIWHSSYSDKYYKSRIPMLWLKKNIDKKGIFRIDMANLHDYFGDIGEDPETVYLAIKRVLLKEGIIVNMIVHESVFLTFSFNDVNKEKIYTINKEKEELFHKYLKDNKLFDEETKYLSCPECSHYSVEYSISGWHNNKW
jgi:hypothetical protein